MREPQSSQHLGVILVLALRNLRRNARRTILTATALMVGGALLIFSLLLGDGTHEQWIDSGVRTGSGHVTIERPEFRLSRKIEDRLPASTRPLVTTALKSPDIASHVTSVFARLAVTGLASSASGARPAQILGVDPVTEATLSPLDEQVIDGRYLEPGDRLAAYVGVGLVESLDLRLGSRLVLTAQDTHKEIAGQLVRVVGVFRSGIPEIDQSLIHIPLDTAGEWLGTGHDVTNIGVMLDDSTAVAGLVQHLRRELADPLRRGEAVVMGWQEAMPALRDAVLIDEWGSYVMFGILFIIIGFSIVNTVLMSVLHRYREFGVLQALGLTPPQTGAVVLIEGLVLTGLSGVAGVALGFGLTWFFLADGLDMTRMMDGLDEMTFSGIAIDPVIYPVFRMTRVVQSLGFIVFLGALASVYPAVRAATVDAAEAMKFER
jgi:ABC-type lipoprotein release transport system permease subunit